MARQNEDGRYVRVRKRLVQDEQNQPEWRKKLDNLVSPRLKLVLSRHMWLGGSRPRRMRGHTPLAGKSCNAHSTTTTHNVLEFQSIIDMAHLGQ
jgi:hypothetical protein